MFYLRLTICFLLIAITSQSHAANATDDVVYLKNGSIVRGEIIEQVPEEFVKVRTVGGSVFVFEVSEIAAIKKEPQRTAAKKRSPVLAAAMSVLIPGLGQFYNGEYEEGAIHFAFFAVGVLFLRAGVEDDIYLGSLGRLDVDDDDWKTGIGASMWAGTIVDSAYDAYTSAERFNRLNKRHVCLRFTPIMASRKHIGARLSFTF